MNNQLSTNFVAEALSAIMVRKESATLSKKYGMSQFAIHKWETTDINNAKGWRKLLIEYVLRVDQKENDKLIEKYGLAKTITTDDTFLSRVLKIPRHELRVMRESTPWKKAFYYLLKQQHRFIIQTQIETIEKAMGWRPSSIFESKEIDFDSKEEKKKEEKKGGV